MTSRTEYSTQTPKKSTLFSGEYLRNHWTLDIGVLGYIAIVWPKEHSPEVRSFPPGTPCIVRQSRTIVVIGCSPFLLSKKTSYHSVGYKLVFLYLFCFIRTVWLLIIEFIPVTKRFFCALQPFILILNLSHHRFLFYPSWHDGIAQSV
jgi:hypothetical protein